MELEVWAEHEIPPFVTRLRLVQHGNDVLVCVVTPDGITADCGRLLRFCRSGCIRLHGGVSESFGFMLQTDGKIRVE